MAILWIRLNPPPAPLPAGEAPSAAEALAAAAAALGWSGCGWFPAASAALAAVSGALGGRNLELQVVAGIGRGLLRALHAAGCRPQTVDLDPDTLQPAWTPAVPAALLEHRHGVPAQPPPGGSGPVLEWVDEALGGRLVDGRCAGALGDAGLVRGRAWPLPFRGLLAGSPDPDLGRRLAAAGRRPPAPVRRALAAGAALVADQAETRRAAAQVYRSAFRPLGLPIRLVPPEPAPGFAGAVLPLRAPAPAALARFLARRGVETRRPLNRSRLQLLRGPDERAWPGAAAFYRQALLLPVHHDLGMGELVHAADAVRAFFAGRPEVFPG